MPPVLAILPLWLQLNELMTSWCMSAIHWTLLIGLNRLLVGPIPKQAHDIKSHSSWVVAEFILVHTRTDVHNIYIAPRASSLQPGCRKVATQQDTRELRSNSNRAYAFDVVVNRSLVCETTRKFRHRWAIGVNWECVTNLVMGCDVTDSAEGAHTSRTQATRPLTAWLIGYCNSPF